VLLWSAENRPPGEHTSKIRVVGERDARSRFTWVAIDRVEVLNPAGAFVGG